MRIFPRKRTRFEAVKQIASPQNAGGFYAGIRKADFSDGHGGYKNAEIGNERSRTGSKELLGNRNRQQH